LNQLAEDYTLLNPSIAWHINTTRPFREHIRLNGECVPKFQADTAPSRSTTPTAVLFFIIDQRNSHYSKLNIAYSMPVLVVERYWQEFAVGGASEGVQGIASRRCSNGTEIECHGYSSGS